MTAERDDAGTPLRDGHGRVRSAASGAGGQGSHVISALATADALAVIPEADDELPAGAAVALWWLDGRGRADDSMDPTETTMDRDPPAPSDAG